MSDQLPVTRSPVEFKHYASALPIGFLSQPVTPPTEGFWFDTRTNRFELWLEASRDAWGEPVLRLDGYINECDMATPRFFSYWRTSVEKRIGRTIE